MRSRAAAAGALLGAALAGTVLAGPRALAEGLEINPSTARPGETVTIEGACGKNNDAMATVTSPALPTQQADVGDRGWFSVEATVKNVKPGQYEVTMSCNMSDKQGTGTLRVKPKSDHYPDGGAMTGGGGAQDAGFPWTVAGSALLFGAAALGGVAALRARGRT